MHKAVQDLTGKVFYRLTVIQYIGKKGKDTFWLCKCECGQIKEIRGAELKRGNTKSCGCLQKETASKMAKSMIGILHPNWIFDRDKLSRKGRPRSDQAITRHCYARDNYTCQCCSKRGGKLNAHHLYNWKDYPKLRFELNNLITLCDSCHRKFHKIYGIKHTMPNQFQEFRELNYAS